MLSRLHVPALYLVRHGEPDVTGVLLGRTDAGLSDAGRAMMAGLELPAGVEAVYTSTRRRAGASAALMARSRPVIVLPDLDEIDYGEWDGRSWADIERADPELAARKLRNWTGTDVPGAEPWRVFASRVERALDHIRKGPLPAAAIGHIAVNSWIFHKLTGKDFLSFKQAYGSVYRCDLPDHSGARSGETSLAD